MIVHHPAFKRILVTGGTGFMGRHLLRRLNAKNIRPLVTVSREDRDTGAIPAEVAHIDLGNRSLIGQLISEYHPTAVIHLAGATGHNDPTGELCRSLNYEATVSLVDALRKAEDLHRLILIGSAAEYGDQTIPFRENMQPRPISHYARSKAAANEYALASGLPVTVLRVFTAYGLGQPAKMFLSQLIECAVRNAVFEMSEGSQRRDLVHIDDVVEAMTATLKADAARGRTLNIGSGTAVRLREIARAVWRTCGADPERLQIGRRECAGDDAFDTQADVALAAEILDWRPRTQILVNGEAGTALTAMIARTSETHGVERTVALNK